MDPYLRKTLGLAFSVKLMAFFLVGAAFYFFPFLTEAYRSNFHFPLDETPGPLTCFKTWDAQHYLYLAQQGYARGQMSDAFSPLFPFLIRVFSFLLGGNFLLSGLLLSNLFAVGSMGILFLWVKKFHGGETAYLTCVFLLAFPGAFYQGLVYTESLFLLLSVGFFYFRLRRQWILASFCAFCLPLARIPGILIALPALVDYLRLNKPKEREERRSQLFYLASCAAGLGIYLLWMGLATGNIFSAFEAQGSFGHSYGSGIMKNPLEGFFIQLLQWAFPISAPSVSLLNPLLIAAALGITLYARKALGPALFAYTLGLILILVVSDQVGSTLRYLGVLFPLFMMGATRLKGSLGIYLAICVPLQALFILLHALNYWVA